MIITQRKFLKAVIYDRRIDMLQAIKPAWIYDPDLHELTMLVIHNVLEGKYGRDDLYELIASRKFRFGKDVLYREIISELADLGESDHSIIEVLKNDYESNIQKRLINDLESDLYTQSEKTNKVLDASKELVINDTDGFINLQDEVDKYFDLETKDEYANKILEFRSIYLKELFVKLYPFPYLIMARPGFRKTGIMLAMMEDAWLEGKNVLVYSFEDNVHRFRAKWISLRSISPLERVLSHQMTDGERSRGVSQTSPTNRGTIQIVDKKMSFNDWIKSIKSKLIFEKIDCIYIDYVQLFKYRRQDEISELDEISVGIASLCNTYMVPVVVICQVNERDEKGGYVELHLGNAKGSSSLEQSFREVVCLEGYREGEDKVFKVLKSTVNPFIKKTIQFHAESGKIMDVRRYEA